MAWGTQTTAAEKPASRARNPRKASTPKAAEGLAKALAFIDGATDQGTMEAAKHVKISNHWAVAFDGTVSAGHPVEEDITVCPHSKRMADAIKKCGSTLSLSISASGNMTVTGEHAKFVIPCLPLDAMPPVFPDVPIAMIDDRLKEGFAAVTKLAKEDADTVYESSVLLRANSVVGCNGALSLEYWHGIDLPPNLAIPQKAAKLLGNCGLKMERFGFTPNRSATFYFEGGAWIRTQLYGDQWPDIDSVLNVAAYPVELPGLYTALDAISSFSEDGAVHFHQDKLKSTYAADTEGGQVYGASYAMPGLVAGTHCSAKLLKLAQPAAKVIDYQTHPDKIFFFNVEANLRGVLMKRR